jgi:TRAP-type C4-dicarboxylate transport system permease small subunit
VTLLPPPPAAPAALRVLGAAVDWAIVAMGAAIVAVVFANVLLHQLALDIAWTTEFGELVMVWTTFLGAAAAVRRNAHMAVLELAGLLPRAGRRILDAAIQLLVATVLVLLVWKGSIAVQASWGNVLTVLDWPMAVQYLALPVGSAIALVFVLWDLAQCFSARLP